MSGSSSSPSPSQARPEPAWTGRQREVLDLLVRGDTNPEIAQALGISLDGAKWHVSEVITKLGVDSRDEAAEYWRAHNGLRPRFTRIFHALVSSLWLKVAGGVAVVAGASVAIAVVVVALHGSGPSQVGVVATPTATTAATTTPASGVPQATRTGIAEIDAVIDAVEKGDAIALGGRVQLSGLPCAITGMTSPRCPDGVTLGTPLNVFPDAFCEPAFPTDTDTTVLLARLIAAKPRIVAAYRMSPGATLPQPLKGSIALVFERSQPAGIAWQIGLTDDGHIVASNEGCSQTPTEMLSLQNVPAGDFLLGPLH